MADTKRDEFRRILENFYDQQRAMGKIQDPRTKQWAYPPGYTPPPNIEQIVEERIPTYRPSNADTHHREMFVKAILSMALIWAGFVAVIYSISWGIR